ncbi:uncharacterized protein LOC135196784 [Macrobrachium nipponense]|uniref:uncharacterized protein LOC135196784 n=1 Tax=Macrobrachium nipponense TaxID=159736 RepID=UPI0030C83EA2
MRASILLLSLVIGASSLPGELETSSYQSISTFHGVNPDSGGAFFGNRDGAPADPYPGYARKNFHEAEVPFSHLGHRQNPLYLEVDAHRPYHEDTYIPGIYHHPVKHVHGDVQHIRRFHSSGYPLGPIPIFKPPWKRLIGNLPVPHEGFNREYSRGPFHRIHSSYRLRNPNYLLEPRKQIHGNRHAEDIHKRIHSPHFLTDKHFHRLHPPFGFHHRHVRFKGDERLLDPISEHIHSLYHHPDFEPSGPSHDLNTIPVNLKESIRNNEFLGDITNLHKPTEYVAIAAHPDGGTSYVKNRRMGKREAIPSSGSGQLRSRVSEENLADVFLPAVNRNFDVGSSDMLEFTPVNNQSGSFSGLGDDFVIRFLNNIDLGLDGLNIALNSGFNVTNEGIFLGIHTEPSGSEIAVGSNDNQTNNNIDNSNEKLLDFKSKDDFGMETHSLGLQQNSTVQEVQNNGGTMQGNNQEESQGDQVELTVNHQAHQRLSQNHQQNLNVDSQHAPEAKNGSEEMVQKKNISGLTQATVNATATLTVIHDKTTPRISEVQPLPEHLTNQADENAQVSTSELQGSPLINKNRQVFIPEMNHGQRQVGNVILNSSYSSVPEEHASGHNVDQFKNNHAFIPEMDHGQSPGGITILNSSYSSVPTEHPHGITTKPYVTGQGVDYASGNNIEKFKNNYLINKGANYDSRPNIIGSVPVIKLQEIRVLPALVHSLTPLQGHDSALSRNAVLEPFVDYENSYRTGTIPLEEGLGILRIVSQVGHGTDPASRYAGNYGVVPVQTHGKNHNLDTINFLQDHAVKIVPNQNSRLDKPAYLPQGNTLRTKFHRTISPQQSRGVTGRPSIAYHTTKPHINQRNSFPTPSGFQNSFPQNHGRNFPSSVIPRLGYSVNQRVARIESLVHDGKTGTLNSAFRLRDRIRPKVPRRKGILIHRNGHIHPYSPQVIENNLKNVHSRGHHQHPRRHQLKVRPIVSAIPGTPRSRSVPVFVKPKVPLPISYRPSYQERIYNPYLYPKSVVLNQGGIPP